MNKLRRASLAGVGAVALGLALVVPTSAYADASSAPGKKGDSDQAAVVTGPMTIVGYDAEVAQAHGYRIETDANGVQYSVPVTPEAIAEQARDEAAAGSTVQPFGTVNGNCGSSSLTGYKGSNDTVIFSTSFFISTGTIAEYDWAVDANGFFSSNYWRTWGNGPLAGNSAAWTGAITGVVGPGKASVPNGSARASVIKTNGAVCYSGGPWFNFN